MFDLTSFLKDAFGSGTLPTNPSMPTARSWLPELEISPELQLKFEETSLDFLVGMYFSAKKQGDIRKDSELWFLEEINNSIHIVYPGKTRQEYTAIIQHIIKMAEQN